MDTDEQLLSWPVLPALVARAEAAVRQCRAADPYLPIHIVVPNHVLGTLLARALFPDTGYLAIHVQLPHEFAWSIAGRASLAAGLLPVPEEVDLAIVLKAAATAVAEPATPDYLKRAVPMPGFAPAALRTLRDIAAADVTTSALEAFAPNAPDADKVRVLARIADAHQATLASAQLIDRETLYRRAADLLPAADGAGIVFIGDAPESRDLEALLTRLSVTHPFAWLTIGDHPGIAPRRDAARAAFAARAGMTGESVERQWAAGTSLSRVQRSTFAEGVLGQPSPLDSSVRFLSAPGESLEAVEIARLVLEEAARGVRFQDMAVLLREPGAYATHMASAFDRAGISAYFLEGVPGIDPAARALGLLLDLLDADLDRAQVAEFLTTARIPYRNFLGDNTPISPARWDRISARAGIVGGLDAWRAGLAKARESAEEREFDDEIALIDALSKVVERLAEDLNAFPREGSWGAFLSATAALLGRWIERGDKTAERLERVIAPIDRFAPTPTKQEFLARVRDLIASQVYIEGSLAEGRVFVGPTSVAEGLRFRVLFVPGMVERRFPSIARPDPLLLDEERQSLSPAFRTTEDDQEQERVEFVDACAAAGERLVLSYPRVDGQSGRERVPSSFLLRAARAATGARVSAEELARIASAGETSLGRPYPKNPQTAIDLLERDLAVVASAEKGAARHLLDEVPNVARAFDAERSSWMPELTVWDGLVNLAECGDAVAALRLKDRQVSASEVEALGACPYRHFLSVGLRLRKWEEPERTYALDRRDVGTIMHAVLQELFSELKGKGTLPLKPDGLDSAKRRAAKLIDSEFATFMEAGGVVHPALVNAVRDQIRADVDDLLEREVAQGDEFVPDQFELKFEKLSFDFAKGRSLTFRGVMDRLDVAARPKRVRVIDYKGGWNPWKEGEEFRGGRNVQLAIYILAAGAAYPKHEVTDSRYYYSTTYGRFKTKQVEGSDTARDTLKQVLTALDDTVARGAFAPVADACDYCDFDAICGPHKEQRAARKKGDSRLVAFYKMREIP
jgi:ATP-dependent helicase/nuclease subunit B